MSTYFREYTCTNCGETLGQVEERCPMCGEERSLQRVDSKSRLFNVNPTVEVLSGFCLATIALLALKVSSLLGMILLLVVLPVSLFVMGHYYKVLTELGPDDPDAHAAVTFRAGLKVVLAGLIIAVIVLTGLVVMEQRAEFNADPFGEFGNF